MVKNKLLDLGFNHKDKWGKRHNLYRCVCGNEKIIAVSNVKFGGMISCGCYRREKLKKHGMSNTLVYNVWQHMKDRCSNKTNKSYPFYGGRGISFIKRWNNFQNFFNDMGETYKDGLTLERINVNKGYSKNNCRWATRTEQSNNRRDNINITYKGITLNITQWSRRLGIPDGTLRDRILRMKLSPIVAFKQKLP